MASIHNSLYGDAHPANCIDVSGIDLEKVELTKLEDEIKRIKKVYQRDNIYFHPDIALKNLYTYYKEPTLFLNSNRCLAPWLSCNITANGDVIPSNRCEVDSFGNILTKDFISIWNGDKFREFRCNLKREKSFPICSRCSAIHLR
jgi:MoaA/NifB/PqqE/SkfB family radical SAM enzyme